MTEVWRDVPGYEGLYVVSDAGRVRRRGNDDFLKPAKTPQGRLQVGVRRDGFETKRQIHRLVLEAFTGPCPKGLKARHADGDYTNNRLRNLSWAPHAACIPIRIANGNRMHGERHACAKLTADAVRAIRSSTCTQRALAAQHGVSNKAICAVLSRRTWGHVK
jgi:hypothetical protein